MKKFLSRKIAAGLMSSVMLCSALPMTGVMNVMSNSVVFAEDSETTENVV